MLPHDSEIVLVYLILYALLCIPIVLYLRRKGASRRLQFGTFIAMTVVVIVSILQRLGVVAALRGEDVPAVVSVLIILGTMGWFCYRVRSLGAFLLFALALGIMLLYFNLMDFMRDRGASHTSRMTVTYLLGAGVLALLLSSGIVGYRSYFIRKGGGR